jgi:hypothetical protein
VVQEGLKGNAVAHFKLVMISGPFAATWRLRGGWETRLRGFVVSLAQCTIALEVVSEQGFGC